MSTVEQFKQHMADLFVTLQAVADTVVKEIQDLRLNIQGGKVLEQTDLDVLDQQAVTLNTALTEFAAKAQAAGMEPATPVEETPAVDPSTAPDGATNSTPSE